MHAVGLHSALAIRRERKRRAEQQRARERRYSLQSTESGLTSPHCSTGSLERRRHRAPRYAGAGENEVVSSVGMLHLGVVFLVLGLFLVASGWLPDDVTSWSAIGSGGWWNELVCAGLFALGLGVFLVALHKYLTKSEEDALEDYVQRQLTRSRSGHRLERDAETGGMLTKHETRLARLGPTAAAAAAAAALEPGGPASPPATALRSPPPDFAEHRAHAHGFVNALAMNGEAMRETPPPLEQIAEEECSVASEPTEGSRRLDRFNRDTFSAASAAPSLSPPTPSDTRELLGGGGRYLIMSRM